MTQRSGTPLYDGRLEELLLDNALWGLDLEETREFEDLVGRSSDPRSVLAERDALELSSAAAALAMTPSFEAMPQSVRELVENQAFAFLSGKSAEPGTIARPEPPQRSARASRSNDRTHEPILSANDLPRTDLGPSPNRGWVPWITALASAAIILIAIEGFRSGSNAQPAVSAEVAYRALDQDPQALSMDWESAVAPVGGRVVWDSRGQTGVMRLDGLQPNDPTEMQYQLWIFDDSRPHRHPVDGGVFDVTENGEIYVRFESALPVDRPVAFVVTKEAPGGVVVSDRSQIACAAGVANIRE